MRTIRRLYLYGVALISLLVVTWGLIGLARSAFAGERIGGDVARLAGALSLIFVGVPIFLLHWWLAQKSAREDEEERFSRVRAFFLFGSLLATLIPVVQNVLAFINRALFELLDLPQLRLAFGSGQTWSDHIIAIAMNGLIALYLFSVLRANWDEENISEAFLETRRLYRLVWMLYGLGLSFVGVQTTLLYLLDELSGAINSSTRLANGLTFAIVGVPLWVYSWRILQKAYAQSDEQQSLMRLVVLYSVRLLSMFIALFAVGAILNELILFALGVSKLLRTFLLDITEPFAVAIPAGLIWFYYSSVLKKESKAADHLPYRVELQRLYSYITSFLGLATLLLGVNLLLYALIEASMSGDLFAKGNTQEDLALSLSLLMIGLPLWLVNWLPVYKQARRQNETGEQAQHSLARRIYLYLILFIAVIGLMFCTGALLFQLLQAALGAPESDFAETVLKLLCSLILFGLLLGYHGWVLRDDNRLMARTVAVRHADFPVLILVSEVGAFSEAMVAALRKETPSLPVAVHVVDQGAPDESLSNAKAVILTASIATYPLEAVRVWVQNFSGVRFVIPTPVRGWVWVSGNGSTLKGLIEHTAEMVRKLAEGAEISKTRLSPWGVVGYIFAGLIGLFVLSNLLQLVFTLFSDL